MTKIKFCGLKRIEDIKYANELKPDFIGFVFAPGRKRTVDADTAKELKKLLDPDIKAVGVFVDEDINVVTKLLKDGIIDIAQLHGSEDEEYIKTLRSLGSKEIIKAIEIQSVDDVKKANESSADYVLLDSGKGSGLKFDWDLIKEINRPYFLAGGLNCDNIEDALNILKPYAVDVSSGIETDGFKDFDKMCRFAELIERK
ncbi:MAG: phosphoribosylanthranilate isomerase, partial [Lachnospiraceae bacterium]|nr:phosphoribosylanthranilate isomerase [Lachnospiraceae bacterium]